MTGQLLAKGDVEVGTVRNKEKVQNLIDEYPIGIEINFGLEGASEP